MQSFLVMAKEKEETSKYIKNFLKEEKVNPVDIDLQIYEKAMGIEEVRNVQKKLLLKPFRGKTKAVIIQAYEGITMEAQNALLKALEEPPANTLIIISAPRKELFLPTIISRCKIIELKETIVDSVEDYSVAYNTFLDILFNGTIGMKLKMAQDISANKEDLDNWLSKMSIFVRQKLIGNYNDYKYLNLLKLLQQANNDIKSTNVSKRAALENLFLSF
ncbi:MAG: hypothetical protein Q8P26_00550 [Candidatus Levybacteria bacterium]|nr:hypothetical protein [Candidatus Levybacteria bacterium]